MRVRSFIQYNCAMGLSFGDEIGLENGSKFDSQNPSHKVVRHNAGQSHVGSFSEQRLVIELQFKLFYRVPLCFSHLAKLFEL